MEATDCVSGMKVSNRVMVYAFDGKSGQLYVVSCDRTSSLEFAGAYLRFGNCDRARVRWLWKWAAELAVRRLDAFRSLISESDHGIYAGGAARGDPAGDQRDGGEKNRDGDVSYGIARADSGN
jgi:hypothetical protein